MGDSCFIRRRVDGWIDKSRRAVTRKPIDCVYAIRARSGAAAWSASKGLFHVESLAMALAKLSAYWMICGPIAGRKSYRTTTMFYWVATKLKG